MVQYVNVKCTIMLFFTDITCFPPDLTEVAPLNISGKFKFHNFIVPIKSQIFKPQHLYNLVCCTYFCFYAKCLKKMGNRTLGGHSINARTRRGRQVISRKSTLSHVNKGQVRGVARGGAEGALAPRNLADQLTLFKPGGADYNPHTTASPPRI